MTSEKRLNVIIVGGSVAGLTLAHGLHHNNIDYVVLEAGQEMAPHVGASIVLLPNGLRVLDQLGIADDVLAAVDPIKTGHTWTTTGKNLSSGDVALLTGIRGGYSLAFMLRSELLRIIAAHISRQETLLTDKRVTHIEHHEHGVTVVCEDGTSYDGDIVVGADGIHSVVRRYMQQHMDSITLGKSLEDQSGLSSEYSCIYGFGHRIPGQLVTGDCHRSYGKDMSTLAFIGKDKIFWFLFEKYNRRIFGEDIPRFNNEDCAEHLKNFHDVSMTGEIKYKDVLATTIFSNMLPLEELKHENWTSDRFVCIGDSIHKMTPNLGAGGNAAIESAAALINSLAQLKNGSTSLSEIRLALQAFSAKRKTRANIVCDAANELTRLEAEADMAHKLMAEYVVPNLGDYLADITCEAFVGAELIECLPVPPRSLTATMPWNPEQGIGKQEKRWRRALYALPLLLIFYCASRTMNPTADSIVPGLVASLRDNGGIMLDDGSSLPVLARFTGDKAVDALLRVYVAIFTPSIASDVDHAGRAQAMMFLGDLVPVQAIWMIESYRRGNFMTVAHLLPTIAGIAYQLKGIGLVAPIYYFLHYVQSPLEKYAAADNRMLQLGPVKTIIPSITLGYIVPTMAMLFWPGLSNRQWINGVLWQPFPIYTMLLQRLFSKFVTDTTAEDRKHNPEADMPWLNRIYVFAGTIAALAYTYVHLTSPTSLPQALFSGLRYPASSSGFVKDVAKFLRYDQISAFSAGAVWTMLNFADLKRQKKVKSGWLTIVGAFTGVGLLAGPGAAMAAMAAWRERCLVPKRVYADWRE